MNAEKYLGGEGEAESQTRGRGVGFKHEGRIIDTMQWEWQSMILSKEIGYKQYFNLVITKENFCILLHGTLYTRLKSSFNLIKLNEVGDKTN